jgi:UDP-N-acetylglucosamine enolpyruvyl transferase
VEYFEITGGTPLHGSITLQGSKNAALPLMAASILHPGRTTLHHVPAITMILAADSASFVIISNKGISSFAYASLFFYNIVICPNNQDNFKISY